MPVKDSEQLVWVCYEFYYYAKFIKVPFYMLMYLFSYYQRGKFLMPTWYIWHGRNVRWHESMEMTTFHWMIRKKLQTQHQGSSGKNIWIWVAWRPNLSMLYHHKTSLLSLSLYSSGSIKYASVSFSNAFNVPIKIVHVSVCVARFVPSVELLRHLSCRCCKTLGFSAKLMQGLLYYCSFYRD